MVISEKLCVEEVAYSKEILVFFKNNSVSILPQQANPNQNQQQARNLRQTKLFA